MRYIIITVLIGLSACTGVPHNKTSIRAASTNTAFATVGFDDVRVVDQTQHLGRATTR